MNKIRIYSTAELNEAIEQIISKKNQVTDVKLFDEIDPLFSELVKKSKQITQIEEDINLAIAMDEHPFFKQLTKAEADKEELWATLNIEYFSEYTKRRWLSGDFSSKQARTRVFKAGKMFYNRNSMARLWWITKRSKDETLTDPYTYTRILLQRTQFEQSIMESTIAKNDELLKKLMRAIVKYEKDNDGKQISSSEIILIAKRLNLLGGTYVLDIMNEQFFSEVIIDLLGRPKGGIFGSLRGRTNVFNR